MMGSGKERKVCFIASSGGHWEELMCLKSVAQKYDAFYVTEEGGQANDASANLKQIINFFRTVFQNGPMDSYWCKE